MAKSVSNLYCPRFTKELVLGQAPTSKPGRQRKLAQWNRAPLAKGIRPGLAVCAKENSLFKDWVARLGISELSNKTILSQLKDKHHQHPTIYPSIQPAEVKKIPDFNDDDDFGSPTMIRRLSFIWDYLKSGRFRPYE